MSSLTVVCPSARRYVVKVTPGKLIREVLEEACLKSGYDVNLYEVKNGNKSVDLSLPFRLSGLTNNATLQMVETSHVGNAVAEIALQLSEGGRQQAQLSVTSSLQSVLIHFSTLFGQDLSASENNKLPCCIYMNKQYCGQELERTTLKSIGINSGKCLIRYTRLGMSDKQLKELADKQAEDAAKKAAMAEKFEKLKVENEDREKLEAERIRIFNEEVARAEAERLERERLEQEQNPVSNLPEPPGILSDAPIFGQNQLSEPPQRDPNAWSFDGPVFSAAPIQSHIQAQSNRLADLNRLLQQVDSSLSSRATPNDRLTNILADEGRVRLSHIAEVVNRPASPEAMETGSEEEQGPAFVEPCERKPIRFHKMSELDPTAQQVAALDDEFFEIRVEDAKSIQRDLREQVKSHTNRSLVPSSYVEQRNKTAKLAAYSHTVIRFVCGNETIQALFNTAEPSCRLFEFVNSLLIKAKNNDFKLHLPLNIKIESSDTKNLLDIDVAPKSTVYIKLNDNSLIDDADLFDPAVPAGTMSDADSISAEWLQSNQVFKPYTPVDGDEAARVAKRPAGTSLPADYASSQPAPKAAGPKWLKKK